MRDYNGYSITANGEVYGLNGKLRKPVLKQGRYEMRFSGGKTYPVARIVYAVFHEDFDLNDTNQCITFIDNNKLNVKLDNLMCVYRGDLIQGDGHRNRAKLSEETAKQIKEDYAKTLANRPVNQYDRHGEYNSYRSLAREYGVTPSLIKQVIEGNTRNKINYKLHKKE